MRFFQKDFPSFSYELFPIYGRRLRPQYNIFQLPPNPNHGSLASYFFHQFTHHRSLNQLCIFIAFLHLGNEPCTQGCVVVSGVTIEFVGESKGVNTEEVYTNEI